MGILSYHQSILLLKCILLYALHKWGEGGLSENPKNVPIWPPMHMASIESIRKNIY